MTYFVYLMYRMTNYFTRTDEIVRMMDCNLATYAIYTTDDIDSLYRQRLQRCVHYATKQSLFRGTLKMAARQQVCPVWYRQNPFYLCVWNWFFTKAFRQSRQSGNSFQWLGQALYIYTNPPVQQEATTGLIRQQRTLASERVARDYRYGGFTGISYISILLGLRFFRQRL